MGLDGYVVIDADGHGAEPLDWRERIPSRYRPQMEQFVARMKGLFGDLPGGAMRLDSALGEVRYVERPSNPLRFDPEGTRPGMFESVGDDAIVYASDYCHFDCAFPESVRIVVNRDDLTAERKAAILGTNAARFYGLPLPATARS